MATRTFRFLAALLIATVIPTLAQQYELGPDSKVQPNVPRGKITKHKWTSEIFPGTVRDYWLYVPAQYSSSEPAAVMVFQDGQVLVSTEDGRMMTPIVLG